MQAATASSKQTAWQKVTAFVIAVCVVGLALFCAIGSARLINEPFPGFLVLENGVIASAGLPHWPTAVHGDSIYQHVVIAVNGQPVTTGEDVYNLVSDLPLGAPVTYLLEKDTQKSQVTFPSLFFHVKDYLWLQGVYLFTGLTIALIGLVVWFLHPAAPASQALLVQCLTFGVYILTAADLYAPYWFFRVHVMCEALYPAGFFHLALVFPVDRLRSQRAVWITFLYGLAFMIGLAYQSVLTSPSLYTWIHILCESLSGVGMLIFLGGVFWDYRTSSSPLVRRRVRVIFLGACGGFIIPAGLMLWSGLTGGGVAMNNATFTLFLFPLSVGYAIVKHDLFEIDILIKRSVYYLTLTTLLMFAYLGVVAVLDRTVAGSTVAQSSLFTLLFTSGVVLLLNPLKEHIQRTIDRLFFRLQYDPQAILETVSNYLASTLRLEEIVAYVWNTISGNLGIRQGAIYLYTPDRQSYKSVYPIGQTAQFIEPTHLLLTVLRQQNGRAFSAHHLESEAFSADTRDAVHNELERLQASLVVPLVFQGECIGMIVLGRKESGRFFSTSDLDFLHLLAHQGVLALSNAQTYQELEELNKDLESKVTDRTQELAQANTQLGQTNTELQVSLERLEQTYQDLEHSQEQLVQAEKMAAFGRLTAGIAHEVNTPLGASMTSLTLIHKLAEEYEASIGDPEVTEQDYREITKEMKQYVSDAHEWLEKAAGYIQSLKRHSRSLERGVEEDFSLLQILEDTERLLSHELRLSECRVVIENISPQLTLHGDSGKLGQVFTNLITNAIDAYKETDTGRGDIRIAVNDDSEDLEDLHVLVQDHATGIPSEHCEQIFEEFFSTKLQGKGTGLGLGICRNIMSNLFSGTLTVESDLGQGSTFILTIPRQQHKSPDSQESCILSTQETSLDDTLLAA